MSLELKYVACCDRFGCRARLETGKTLSSDARRLLKRHGWALVRWRVEQKPGASHVLALCPRHRGWTPRSR